MGGRAHRRTTLGPMSLLPPGFGEQKTSESFRQVRAVSSRRRTCCRACRPTLSIPKARLLRAQDEHSDDSGRQEWQVTRDLGSWLDSKARPLPGTSAAQCQLVGARVAQQQKIEDSIVAPLTSKHYMAALIRRRLTRLALEAGLDRSYVGRIERGSENITVSTLEALAVALGAPVGALFQEVADGAPLPPPLRAGRKPKTP